MNSYLILHVGTHIIELHKSLKWIGKQKMYKFEWNIVQFNSILIDPVWSSYNIYDYMI